MSNFMRLVLPVKLSVMTVNPKETNIPKEMNIMRRFLFGLAAFAAVGTVSALPDQAHSQVYPWCRSRAGGTNCYFSTRAQCGQALGGGGGYCHLNPFYGQASYPLDQPRPAPKIRH